MIGAGTEEDRILQVQAKKREALLQSNGHLNFDYAGKIKRRDSDERNVASASTSQLGDRDALVYVHKVKPEDTLAGILIKYDCSAPIFTKANRLWSNDRVQIRKVVYLPIDACGVKGRKLPDDEVPSEGRLPDVAEDTLQTPTNIFATKRTFAESSTPKDTPIHSIPTSPSISVTTYDDAPYTHDSWVSLPNFPFPVEIARLSRRSLGYFPPSRRKSLSFSDLETPSASLDLPRIEHRTTPRRRGRSSVSRNSNPAQDFMERLQGPGGVGTLGREVMSPGPAQDGLNRLFAPHLPNVAPRSSFESMQSNSSTGIENVGGKIESWVRKMATKAKDSMQSPDRGRGANQGDLIELSEGFDGSARDMYEHPGVGGVEFGNTDQSFSRSHEIDQEDLLSERFPPRGRVFDRSGR